MTHWHNFKIDLLLSINPNKFSMFSPTFHYFFSHFPKINLYIRYLNFQNNDNNMVRTFAVFFSAGLMSQVIHDRANQNFLKISRFFRTNNL